MDRDIEQVADEVEDDSIGQGCGDDPDPEPEQ